MAKIQGKLVDLKGLNAIVTSLRTQIGLKLDAPLTGGTAGQVLTARGDGTSEWKHVQGSSSSVDEATIRRIVNEQLAKMKFTINDQGHLIIETPEA